MRPNPKRSAPKKEGVQFVVIPTAMTGASSIQHDLPVPIIFYASATKPTKEIMEYGKGDEESLAAVIETVLNAEFSRIERDVQVQNLTALDAKEEHINGFSASWQASSSSMAKNAQAKKEQPRGKAIVDLRHSTRSKVR